MKYAILVSCGYCIKLPHIWWLHTTEIYFLSVLEATSLALASLDQNQHVGLAVFPLGLLEVLTVAPSLGLLLSSLRQSHLFLHALGGHLWLRLGPR